MGADGHHPQPAQAVQGIAGNGLRVLLRTAGFLADQFADPPAVVLCHARRLLPTCDRLIVNVNAFNVADLFDKEGAAVVVLPLRLYGEGLLAKQARPVGWGAPREAKPC